MTYILELNSISEQELCFKEKMFNDLDSAINYGLEHFICFTVWKKTAFKKELVYKN